jgi:UDP-N-acetyl-D-mannosaminuronate dehydrogenase
LRSLPADASLLPKGAYDAVILAVAHTDFTAIDGKELLALFRDPDARVLFDVKSALDPSIVTDRL